MALADFSDAIRDPADTGFFCYRCIESMMQSMKVRDDEADKPAWSRFRETLRIDRSAIDAVKAHADDTRHGRPTSISHEQRELAVQLTDKIIERFLEYLANGKAALTEAKFEMLKPDATRT